MLSSTAESRGCSDSNDRPLSLFSEEPEVGTGVEVVEGDVFRVLYTELALGASILSAMLKQ